MTQALSRREQLELDIVDAEKKVEEITDAWTTAKFNRDPVQIKEMEERLIDATTELNVLKMRRPV